MKKNTYMHFEDESIIYIWSKFQLDTCLFDSNILLKKIWSRILVPGFILSRYFIAKTKPSHSPGTANMPQR